MTNAKCYVTVTVKMEIIIKIALRQIKRLAFGMRNKIIRRQQIRFSTLYGLVKPTGLEFMEMVHSNIFRLDIMLVKSVQKSFLLAKKHLIMCLLFSCR